MRYLKLTVLVCGVVIVAVLVLVVVYPDAASRRQADDYEQICLHKSAAERTPAQREFCRPDAGNRPNTFMLLISSL